MEYDLPLDFHQQHKRGEKPLNLGRDHGFTALTVWASVGYFRFTSALNHSSYFPPNLLEGFDLWNRICFLNYVVFGLFFPSSFDLQCNLSSFIHGFWHFPCLGSTLSFLFGTSQGTKGMTYLFFLDLPSYHFYSSVNPWTPHTPPHTSSHLLILCFPTAWALSALTSLTVLPWDLSSSLVHGPRILI